MSLNPFPNALFFDHGFGNASFIEGSISKGQKNPPKFMGRQVRALTLQILEDELQSEIS
jgi:hypothetical protein